MAEINVERKSAGTYTWMLAALSVVLIAGFLWWLSANAESTTGPVVMEEGQDAAEAAEDARLAVTLSQLGAGPQSYVGREIAVADMPVSSRMGAQAFWTELPGGQPFLVKMDPALVASGESVSSGERLSVRGMVHVMTDSVLSAWEASGAIGEAERPEAEFAQHFLEASRLRPSAGGQQGDNPEE